MVDIDRAITFLKTQDRPVELAWARYTAGQGPADEIVTALERYQNADCGFGNNLEVDIHAPDSQAFAARLAMHVLTDAGVPADHPMVTKLAGWLEREQGEDGDWRFPSGVYEHQLAPWFQGWTFPSPNPSLSVAGAAKRLGIGSPRMFERVDALIAQHGNVSDAESGNFYEVLPYAEYFPWSDHPERERFIDAIARGIAARAETGGYEDAGHFFEHAGGPDSLVSQRLPRVLIDAQLDRLEAEQAQDGGWPSPYDPRWRPWTTAAALSTLRAYGRLPLS